MLGWCNNVLNCLSVSGNSEACSISLTCLPTFVLSLQRCVWALHVLFCCNVCPPSCFVQAMCLSSPCSQNNWWKQFYGVTKSIAWRQFRLQAQSSTKHGQLWRTCRQRSWCQTHISDCWHRWLIVLNQWPKQLLALLSWSVSSVGCIPRHFARSSKMEIPTPQIGWNH